MWVANYVGINFRASEVLKELALLKFSLDEVDIIMGSLRPWLVFLVNDAGQSNKVWIDCC